jgi:diacylglycerol kinase (ATP)
MNGSWYFIVNLVAGNGKATKIWPQLVSALDRAGVQYAFEFTQYQLHAKELCLLAIDKGYRRICTIGGDGTNHEVINGIMEQKVVPTREIMYSLFPSGRGNDWARTYQLNQNSTEFIHKLTKGQTICQDIGLISCMSKTGAPVQRYFANVAGMAYDAFVVEQAEKKQGLTSELAYLFLVFSCLFRYQLTKLRIKLNGTEVKGAFYTINVGICTYSGGGMQLVPHAIANDGQLAVTIARAMPKWEVLWSTPRFYNGSIASHRKVQIGQTKTIEIVHEPGQLPTLIEADGELIGQSPIVISLIENALKVVY